MTKNTSSNTSKKEQAKKGPKVKMNMNFLSPIKTNRVKRSTWGNHLDIYETDVDPIVIGVCTRMDKPEGSYITPMVRAFNDDETENLPDKWKILSFLSRRGNDEESKAGERNAMKKGGIVAMNGRP
jgi:hypothetical protein